MINPWPHSGWKGCSGILLLGLVLVGCGAAAEDKAASPLVEATSVGDEVCASCHAEIVETYRLTNKALAITRFDPATAPERFDDTDRVLNNFCVFPIPGSCKYSTYSARGPNFGVFVLPVLRK